MKSGSFTEGKIFAPLLTVAVAAVFNVLGDLLLVAVFHMGAAGAAAATTASQALSVVISYLFIRRLELLFPFSKRYVRADFRRSAAIAGLGFPIAFADLLVGISFLVIIAIVNSLGVTASTGIGVHLPASWLLSRRKPVSLFRVGMATPCASFVQTVLCLLYFLFLHRRGKEMRNPL